MVGVAIVMVIAAITRQGASVWMGLGLGLLLSVILFFRGWEAKDKAQSKNQGSHDNKA